MTTPRKRITPELRQTLISSAGTPAAALAEQLGLPISSIRAVWTAARKAGDLGGVRQAERLAPALVADILVSQRRETLSSVATRLGLTRSAVASYRHRAEALLKRPDVREAYDRLTVELGPVLPVAEPAAPSVEPGREGATRQRARAESAVASEPARPEASLVAAEPGLPPPAMNVPAPVNIALALSPLADRVDRDRAILAQIPSGISAAALAVGLLRSDTCRWPKGHPTDPDFTFCGAPAPVERPYCPACAGLAYSGRAPSLAHRAFVGAPSRRAA